MADTPTSPAVVLHPAPSPLLSLPGAVAGSGLDATVPWHYGDPIGEQRRADRGTGLVDRTHREVLTVAGPDRLDWLNKLTSQLLLPLADGTTTEALILSPTGHVEHHFGVTELSGTVYLDTDPGWAATLQKYLEMMKFWSQVDIAVSDLRQLSLIGPGAGSVDDAPRIGSATSTSTGFVRRTAPFRGRSIGGVCGHCDRRFRGRLGHRFRGRLGHGFRHNFRRRLWLVCRLKLH